MFFFPVLSFPLLRSKLPVQISNYICPKSNMCLSKLEIVFAVDVLQGFLRFTLLRTKLPVSPRLSLLAAENAETTLFPIEFSS